MWKVIPSFENYLINKDGIIKNSKGKILSFFINKDGYKINTLYSNKKRKKRSNHSLVLEAFVGIRPKKMTINHIDGNKLNNNIKNLEYVSMGDNHRHAYSISLKNATGEKNGYSKLTEKDIVQIKKLIGKLTQKEIANKFKIDQSTVSCIKTGKLWSHVL